MSVLSKSDLGQHPDAAPSSRALAPRPGSALGLDQHVPFPLTVCSEVGLWAHVPDEKSEEKGRCSARAVRSNWLGAGCLAPGPTGFLLSPADQRERDCETVFSSPFK